ncbi:serine/threonine-protein kinase [Acaryochloris sp. IP29b_bin.137]|uniref:serine/threonine-protein kinase n=1 Tax=Acaryochloris sp. IP29b_bin.137 TaxID=2969217 RepID=UPI00260EE3A4|nr:serine/threonine-protein kinase [Acaryochloris sp. IP29b_bin.137]
MEGLVNGRYRILKALNEGGFGKTFLAEDVQMPSRRFCVIKQLKPVLNNDRVQKIVLERFQREAAILERIGQGHPQIPGLFAYFEEAGRFNLVQEWIEGQTLTERVKTQGPLNEADVIKLLYQILNVLNYIHGHNIIHRDIKPDNIIVRNADQQPCLIDFGAVKEVMATQINAQGQPSRSIVIGTLGFMPREQAAGRPTFASDLYSLGLTAIYLLTGKFPDEFETNSTTGRLLWKQDCEHLSAPFKSLVDQLVKPHPKHRFATVAAMRTALQSVTQASTVLSQPSSGDQSLSTARKSLANSLPVPKGKLGNRLWIWIGLTASGVAIASTSLFFFFRPQWHYFWGQQAAQSGNWQSATENFEQALELKKDYTEAALKLGETYAEIGKYSEAMTQFDRLIQQQPKTAAAYRERGEISFATGEYQAAIADYNEALKIDPKDTEAYNHRGDTQVEIGQYKEAIADYRQAIRLQPDQPQGYINLATVFFTQGKLEAAVKELDKAIQADDSHLSAHVIRGSYRSILGDRDGAKRDWERALERPVRTAKEYSSRGYAKSRLDRKQDAIADYNQALSINPKLTRAHTNLGSVFYEQGKTEQARKAFDQALETNPNATNAYLLRGELRAYQSGKSDFEGALKDYDRAIAINPNDPFVLNNRCGALFSLNELQRALDDCTKGLEINPSSAALYTLRGNIRLRLKQYENAIQDYGRTIKINADRNSEIRSQAAFSNRASARVQLQDLDGALSDLNEAIRLKPDAAEDYYKRGLLYSVQNKRQDAITDLRRAADLYAKQGRTDDYNNVLSVLRSLGAG